MSVFAIVAIMLILLTGGVWIASAMGFAGMVAFVVEKGLLAVKGVGQIAWASNLDFALTAVPLFILMGEIIMYSGLGDRLYTAVSVWLGRMPGGLLLSNIGACAVFAAISGSSVATAATITTVAYPQLQKRGYDPTMIVGSLAAGGTLGILIPPSIPLIIYSSLVGESAGQLLMAGFLPGITLSLFFMAYIALRATLQPGIAPKEEAVRWKERGLTTAKAFPIVLLILIILGSIYLGVTTPTEAAAVGVVFSLLIALSYRKLSLGILNKSLVSAVGTTAMVLFIIIGAKVLTTLLVYRGFPALVTSWLLSIPFSPLVVFAGICLMYVILGMFFDSISMMVLTLPFIHTVITGLGFNLVWFGIIIVILIEIGLLTPPVAMNLYVLQGMTGCSLQQVARGSLPFVIIMLGMIGLLVALPDIALWLPSQMIKR